MTAHELGVAPEQASEQLRLVADELRASERLTDKAAERAAAALEDPDSARVYVENAPLIARFLTVELDTENKIAKGIGRVHPKEPPPRFGDYFARALRQDAARVEVLPLVDRYAFQGFATGVAANGLRNESLDVVFDTPIEDRWRLFLRHLPVTYAAFTKDPEDGAMAGIRNIVCTPLDEAFEGIVGNLAGMVRQMRRTRARSYSWYFPAVGWSAYYASVPDSI